jgi:hypothetical protein
MDQVYTAKSCCVELRLIEWNGSKTADLNENRIAMARLDKLPKPLLRRPFSISLKSRAALRDNLAQVKKSIFVFGRRKRTGG